MIALGLMAGTSLDGIDAALINIVPTNASYRLTLLRFATVPYEPELRERLVAASPPNSGSIAQGARLNVSVGSAFAAAGEAVVGGAALDYVASHGQTLFHDGAARVTHQVGDPYVLRERLNASVIYDFRSADCAAGGEGAPLVPYVDALLLGSSDEDRVAVNIGGIANLTWIPRAAKPGDVAAFDSGPGNMLIDAYVVRATAGRQTFDRDGALARAGSIDEAALAEMLRDPYFAAAPPKSTGREKFGAGFLDEHAATLRGLSVEDGCATLTALSATTIADAVRRIAAPCRVLLSGGGAHNVALRTLLAERLAGYPVGSVDDRGLSGDAKEAIAFAVLGYETLRERAAGLPHVTGARHPAVLGSIVPLRLGALLAKAEAECAAGESPAGGKPTNP